ncbi:hypothetical protein MKW98_021104 [Papaver atlanticum]|uniref:Uncharacterized protein n=1 Tax=Papaver atlanticum TaxID=357466 RepID=A0AAD4T720_9MAGN|nr:hypothetical protein MKW98_021104 [Papaver atlanticum]
MLKKGLAWHYAAFDKRPELKKILKSRGNGEKATAAMETRQTELRIWCMKIVTSFLLLHSERARFGYCCKFSW